MLVFRTGYVNPSYELNNKISDATEASEGCKTSGDLIFNIAPWIKNVLFLRKINMTNL